VPCFIHLRFPYLEGVFSLLFPLRFIIVGICFYEFAAANNGDSGRRETASQNCPTEMGDQDSRLGNTWLMRAPWGSSGTFSSPMCVEWLPWLLGSVTGTGPVTGRTLHCCGSEKWPVLPVSAISDRVGEERGDAQVSLAFK
jgi:hypothetical protein